MKLFRKLWLFIVSALIALTIVGCSDDDSDSSGSVPEFTLSKSTLIFGGNDSQKSLHLESNVAWEAVCTHSWCKISPNSGTSGTSMITVSLDNEVINAERSCQIAFYTKDSNKLIGELEIIQSPTDVLKVEQAVYNLEFEGGKVEINVTSSGDYLYKSDSEWIIESASTKTQSSKIVFEVAKNVSTESRSGSVEFTLAEILVSVIINQGGCPEADDVIPADMTGMESTAVELASRMKAGWNLGNTMEAILSSGSGFGGNETSWGNPRVTQSFISAVKDAGFNTIRIPCSWSHQLEGDNKIKESWLSRVEEVVGYAINLDMYVMINIHWDGGWLENNITEDKKDENNVKQAILWKQIAKRFRDYDERLLFAGTNEPNVENSSAMAILKSYQQTFIDAVRATGGRNSYRCLILQGPDTNVDKTIDYMDMAKDNVDDRLMMEVHYYDPWNFCGMEKDESWGKMSYYWGEPNLVEGSDRNSGWADEAYLEGQLDKMKKKYVDNSIPVIIGEFGALKKTGIENQNKHDASRVYYYEYFTKECAKRGIVPVAWDNGATGEFGMGLFDRKTETVVEQAIVDAIVGAFK